MSRAEQNSLMIILYAVTNKTAKLRSSQATMAVVEEDWQTSKQSTIVGRTTFIFNNQLLSDVKFVVPVLAANF